MTQSSPVRIELLRIPEAFDADAQRLLGDVASLVQSSRRHVWGTDQLSNEAHDIFRDLKDPYERVNILSATVTTTRAGAAPVIEKRTVSASFAEIDGRWLVTGVEVLA